MGDQKGPQPNWIEAAPPQGSFRSIFKWGDPHAYKHPNARLYRLLKETFNLADDHFKAPIDDGCRPVVFDRPAKVVLPEHVTAICRIVGDEKRFREKLRPVEVCHGKDAGGVPSAAAGRGPGRFRSGGPPPPQRRLSAGWWPIATGSLYRLSYTGEEVRSILACGPPKGESPW